MLVIEVLVQPWSCMWSNKTLNILFYSLMMILWENKVIDFYDRGEDQPMGRYVRVHFEWASAGID